MAFIWKVKTTSGATGVQIAYKQKGKIVKIIHMGSAHTEEELHMRVFINRKSKKVLSSSPPIFYMAIK